MNAALMGGANWWHQLVVLLGGKLMCGTNGKYSKNLYLRPLFAAVVRERFALVDAGYAGLQFRQEVLVHVVLALAAFELDAQTR